MGWRENIAKALINTVSGGKRTDLPTKVYHGTNKTFEAFENRPVDYMLDRGLGTHVAKDPALASTFADRWIKDKGPDYFSRWTKEVKGEPQVYPLRVPGEEKFLQLDQPRRGSLIEGEPAWRGIMHDEHAVERAMADAAYRKDPEMLTRYLVEARAMKPDDAAAISRALVAGERPMIEGRPSNLQEFLANFGGKPYNDADRQRMTDLARQHWEDQGYAGLRYINTSPTEAGAKGVADPTSYIVFNPASIRSEYAAMSPAAAFDPHLLGSVAAGAVGTGAAVANWPPGEVAATDKYDEARQ
jgi:hypothetical protein